MTNPFLIYSNYCIYSSNFLELLKKHPKLLNTFSFLNIDVDPTTNKRPQLFYDIQKQLDFTITDVPTLLLNDGEYILSGTEAFKWLEHQVTHTKKRELKGFNPNEMGSFSDMYSPIGSSDLNNASDQSFKFIHKPNDMIHTPPEDSNDIDFTNPKFAQGNNNVSKEKLIEARLEELIAQRQMNC